MIKRDLEHLIETLGLILEKFDDHEFQDAHYEFAAAEVLEVTTRVGKALKQKADYDEDQDD